MKWWKCEKCKKDIAGEQHPCFIATLESCNDPVWCPWADDPRREGDLDAEWVKCSPAPHEPVKGVRLAEDFPSGVTLDQAYTLNPNTQHRLIPGELTTSVEFEPSKALFVDGIPIHPSWTEETVRKVIFGLTRSNPENLSCDEPQGGESERNQNGKEQ